MRLRCHHLNTNKLADLSVVQSVPTAAKVCWFRCRRSILVLCRILLVHGRISTLCLSLSFNLRLCYNELCAQSWNILIVKSHHSYCWFLDNVVLDIHNKPRWECLSNGHESLELQWRSPLVHDLRVTLIVESSMSVLLHLTIQNTANMLTKQILYS